MMGTMAEEEALLVTEAPATELGGGGELCWVEAAGGCKGGEGEVVEITSPARGGLSSVP